jgi:two-component system chemotaxis sensor kinase CheA
MLPIGTLFSRFQRMVHDLSHELGKDVDLVTEGGETELDKSILDQLGEPLVHMLRNCLDHGIESAEERVAKGKPRRGIVRLHAAHQGSTVAVTVGDDGRGVNRAAVRAKAIEKQLISSEANLSDKEILNLLLLPGFSTASKITNVSGRGVGMDVVKRQIDLLRGSVSISSEEGRGTSISLTLPLTLAIIEGLLVQVSGNRLIFPMSAVTENVELLGSERLKKNGRNVISVRGELVPYIDLRELFEFGSAAPDIEKIVIVEHEEQRVGFVVDRVLGTHQTVLQPLGRFFRNVVVASGATIMGDGGVALILDIASVIKLADRRSREGFTVPAEKIA